MCERLKTMRKEDRDTYHQEHKERKRQGNRSIDGLSGEREEGEERRVPHAPSASRVWTYVSTALGTCTLDIFFALYHQDNHRAKWL